MIFSTIENEAGKLSAIGFPALARIIADSLKTGDSRAVSLTVVRVCGILERGKHWRTAQKLSRLAMVLAKQSRGT